MLPLIIIGVVLLIVAGGLGVTSASSLVGGGSAPPPSNSDNVPAPFGSLGANMITNDPSTWPSSDPIWMVCCAIASAEGANIAGSNPDRLNNPGDISDGFKTYGGETHSGSNVTKFPNKETGWQWLYNKVQNIQNGNSTVYSPDMTWIQIAQKWAGDWTSWVTNVSAFLGVDATSKFSDFTG